MNAENFQELLKSHNACNDAKKWAKGKSWQEAFETCHRGDWLLWLYKKVHPENLRELTLAKGYCAATVLHLMTDQRSKDAVKAAIDFGNGEINREELGAADAAAADAAAADDTAAAYAAYAAADAYAYAAYAAYAAAADAADAAYAAAAADAADAAAAKIKNQLKTANICRKYLPFEIWNI